MPLFNCITARPLMFTCITALGKRYMQTDPLAEVGFKSVCLQDRHQVLMVVSVELYGRIQIYHCYFLLIFYTHEVQADQIQVALDCSSLQRTSQLRP